MAPFDLCLEVAADTSPTFTFLSNPSSSSVPYLHFPHPGGREEGAGRIRLALVAHRQLGCPPRGATENSALVQFGNGYDARGHDSLLMAGAPQAGRGAPLESGDHDPGPP